MSGTLSAVHRFDDIEQSLTDAPDRAAWFADPAMTDALEKRLDALLVEDDDTRILSLDVFDTLLLRDDSAELARFVEIGERMAERLREDAGIDVTPCEAFLARRAGTLTSYRSRDRNEGVREGSLNEIHTVSSRLLTGTNDWAETFVADEIAYETTRTALNAWLAAYTEKHRARGGRVILVTDMYMHAEHVAKLLDAQGYDNSQYDLMVSSADLNLTKASGKIFAKIEAELAAEPSDFVHLGDSLRGDYAQANAAGWTGMHLPLSAAGLAKRASDKDATLSSLRDSHGIIL